MWQIAPIEFRNRYNHVRVSEHLFDCLKAAQKVFPFAYLEQKNFAVISEVDDQGKTVRSLTPEQSEKALLEFVEWGAAQLDPTDIEIWRHTLVYLQTRKGLAAWCAARDVGEALVYTKRRTLEDVSCKLQDIVRQ